MKSLYHSYSTSTFTKFDSSESTQVFTPSKFKPINPQELKNPFQSPKLLKFKKNKFQRKQSNITMLLQTTELKHRSSVKNFHCSNRSSLFDNSIETPKSIKSPGKFCKWGMQTQDIFASGSVQKRSFKDLGITGNKRALAGSSGNNCDPIIIGKTYKETRSYLQKIQKQPRRHRDHGQRIKQNFIWQKTKAKTYLQKFRATRKLRTEAS